MPLVPIRKTFPFQFGVKDSGDSRKFFISELTKAQNVGFIEKDAIELTRAFGFVQNYQTQGIIAVRRIGNFVHAFSNNKIYRVEDLSLIHI